MQISYFFYLCIVVFVVFSMEQVEKKGAGKVVIQSYKLTTIRDNFGLYGQRALLRIVESVQDQIAGLSFKDKRDIRKIDTTIDTDLWGDKIITLDLRSICPEGITHFAPVRDELKAIMKLQFEYEDDETWEVMNFINHVKVNKGTWKATLSVSKDVWKAVMDFSKGFRRIEMEKAMQFQSSYSLRFYELLTGQQEPICYDIEDLKKMFGLEQKYINSPMFIKRVVESAKKELDEISPYTFDYVINYGESTGPGRPPISSLTFFPIHCITRHSGQNDIKDRLSLEQSIGEVPYDILTLKFGVAPKSIKNNLALLMYAKQNMDLEKFLRKIAPKAIRAKNVAGYTVNAIKSELRQTKGVQFR